MHASWCMRGVVGLLKVSYSRPSCAGIATAIYSPSGANTGVGFAVPVDIISSSVNQIIKYGKVIRPILGISFAPDQSVEQVMPPLLPCCAGSPLSPSAAHHCPALLGYGFCASTLKPAVWTGHIAFKRDNPARSISA